MVLCESDLEFEYIKPFSGLPRLRRHCVQKAMNYAAMWPLETQWAWEEFKQLCAFLGIQLVMDMDGVIWFDPIYISPTRLKCF